MRKKIMFVGRSESGKTTLLQSLNKLPLKYDKTQVLNFRLSSIDTPGEYLENPRFYSALITASYDVDVVALIQSADNPASLFAPQFATAFNKPVIGIVTKSDTVPDLSSSSVNQLLRDAGASTIFATSAYNNDGVLKLRQFLNWE
ncbi:EutP/PduV family microcompartment system protein [Vibrio algarum]|uniref:EutP/PduV family microcompartment system protein n=1 Tax=Vibrio algarum TaxID=3020714 RepID=A0ABT4YUK9_9VIBR|nr:EutP/PduV family microcompartment system protein [Vibrio sp. KJ40-1]MDB1125269.1 EutP/PduV family microcompartment system protein [Vibrio sp. KJ40-1]